MSVLAGRCAEPQDKRPGITTSFCVYEAGHGHNHSWQDTPERRRERLATAGACGVCGRYADKRYGGEGRYLVMCIDCWEADE
jgi:hypothetical protein